MAEEEEERRVSGFTIEGFYYLPTFEKMELALDIFTWVLGV